MVLLSLYLLSALFCFILVLWSLRTVDGNPWPETAAIALFVALAWPLALMVWGASAIEERRRAGTGEG